LLDHARRALALFELFFGKESDARNELSDEVAALCNRLQIDYHNATGDDKGCIDLLRATLSFATSIDLRRQIEKNIGTLTGNLTFKQLEPVYAILNALQDSGEHPSVRLNRFIREAVPAISKVSTGSIAGTDDHAELVNAAAIVLRGIALAAWNTHQDMPTALAAATQLALEYARDKELKRRLDADETTLLQMAPHRVAQQKSSNQSGIGCLVVLGIIGLFVLIGSLGSNKSSSSSSYSTSSVSTPARHTTPSSNYSAPTSYTTSETGTYRVPQSRTAELDRDRQAVEAAKARAAQYSSQIESLAREIERDRAYLNRNSQFAVDDFNRKVNRYNSMLEQGRAQDRAVNQMVDDYNTKLRRAMRQRPASD